MVYLPQELLSHICSYLVITPSPFEDRDETGLPDNQPVYLSTEDGINLDTMLDISAASSSLHEAVKPYLYRTITPPMSVTNSLLRTLIDVPSLAPLVQNLSTEEAWRVEEKEFILDHDHPMYSSMAAAMEGKRLPEPLMNDIHRGLDEQSQDALNAVLLLLCPNLTVWMAAFNRDFRGTLVGRTVFHASASKTALQHLQEVNIAGNADTDGYEALSLSTMRDVLELPSLRRIQAYNVDIFGMESFDNLISRPHPNMKEIVLERSLVNRPQSIKALLCAYEGLELLSIEDGGPDRDENLIHDFTGIGDVLRRHGTKLRSLEVVRADIHEEDTLDRTPLVA